MKKILIVNLRRLGDVYSTSHLINSITSSGDSQVHLLTYKETAKAAKDIKNISAHYEIDRKNIITLKTNKLFSDGFSFEQLFKEIEPVHSQNWDTIINFSNDLVGTYLCSYLQDKTNKVVGVHFNNDRNVETKADWDLLFNAVLPELKYSPIHFIDCFHKMSGTKLEKEGVKINTNPTYNEEAFNNISSLRKSLSQDGSVSKIIGIQLCTSDTSKDIPLNTLHELITLFMDQKVFIPLLLIAPNDHERKIAEEFNKYHKNEVIVVEADLTALASVLLNIDLLITPDTAIKHLADLTDTPVIEVSLGHAPFLKQGTYSKDGLILTDVISSRNFKQNSKYLTSNITATDLMATTYFALGKTKSIKPMLSNGVTLYQSSFDKLGLNYTALSGDINTEIELTRLASRQLIHILFEETDEILAMDVLRNLNPQLANEWIDRQKETVTNVMKDLLGTLRSILQAVETKKSSKEFVNNLSRLISHIDNNSMSQIPIMMFKAKIESINVRSFEENAKEVEILLYELKSDMQKVLTCLKEIEVNVNSSKMENLVTRTLESVKI